MTQAVSLTDFCVKFRIDDVDQSKLNLIGYKPGNKHILALESSEWRDVAKFSSLGWLDVLDAHRKFCKMMKEGSWGL